MRGFTISEILETPETSRTTSPESATPLQVIIPQEEPKFIIETSPAPSSKSKSSSRSPDPDRPPYSYNALIAMAIQSSPVKRMKLSEIYEFISTNFPYYKLETKAQWQNSIRHNLSLHKEFRRTVCPIEKGSYWEMTCDLGTDMVIGKECGKLRRQRKTSSRKSTIPEIHQNPIVLPQFDTQTPNLFHLFWHLDPFRNLSTIQ